MVESPFGEEVKGARDELDRGLEAGGSGPELKARS